MSEGSTGKRVRRSKAERRAETRTWRINRLSSELCKSHDLPAVKASMAKFMVGGFLTLDLG